MMRIGKSLLKVGALSVASVGVRPFSKETTLYDFSVRDIQGNLVSLEQYRGKVLLIVNVASLCGLTATNYKELVELDEKFQGRNFRILAFPCNQFSSQEPGSSDDIICFAKSKNVNFDMFAKVDVNGKNADPVWEFLKKKKGLITNTVKWNFTKFIVDHKGITVERHGPLVKPLSLVDNIEKYLQLIDTPQEEIKTPN